jgi:hypothetical protein
MARHLVDQISIFKAMQWELAKGYLRSLAAIEGAASSGETERPYRFEQVEKRVEGFIKSFEDDALHE